MDKISIRGLEVFANHGVFKEVSNDFLLFRKRPDDMIPLEQ